VVHDGYTDLLYVLLPLWQAEFALGYATLATLRALYAGSMAGLQWPASRLAERLGNRALLALGTLCAAAGFMVAGLSGSLAGLAFGLVLSGCGSSTQHPLASATVSRAYGGDARRALGTYNFSGDVGKAAFPGALALLLTVMTWRHALWIMAAVGIAVAAGLACFVPGGTLRPAAHAEDGGGTGTDVRGFSILLTLGVLDTSVRMGLLLFLPFLLKEKGASLAAIGFSFSLLFCGGAAGKFLCGWLGARVGVIRTVLVTESGTAACIGALLYLPLPLAVALLPVLGIMLNGTSSVLYGSVPVLTPPHRTERAFAVFYTAVIGSGALAPVVYGALGDRLGVADATMATAVTALATLPLAFALGPHLSKGYAGPSIGVA